MGKYLFREGIQNILLKKKRTVIMTTDDLTLLPHADKIIILRDTIYTILTIYTFINIEYVKRYFNTISDILIRFQITKYLFFVTA